MEILTISSIEEYKKLGWRGMIIADGKTKYFAGWTFQEVRKKMDDFLKIIKVPVRCECQ